MWFYHSLGSPWSPKQCQDIRAKAVVCLWQYCEGWSQNELGSYWNVYKYTEIYIEYIYMSIYG